MKKFLLILILTISVLLMRFQVARANGNDELQALRIYDRQTSLKLSAFFFDRKIESDYRTAPYVFTRNLITEQIDLDAEGSLLHPRYLKFNLSTGLGYRHGRWKEGEQDRIITYRKGTLRFFKIDGRALTNKPYYFDFFYNRFISGNHQEMIKESRTNLLQARIKTHWLTTWYRTQTDWNAEFQKDHRLENDDLRQIAVKEQKYTLALDWKTQNGANGLLSFNQQHIKRRYNESITAIQKRQMGRVNVYYHLSSEDTTQQLQSTLLYDRLRGDLKLETLSFQTSLQPIYLHDHLYSTYNASIQSYESPEFKRLLTSGHVSLTHQLYLSLRSTVEFHTTHVAYDLSKENRNDLVLRANYQKRIHRGFLLAEVAFQPEWTEFSHGLQNQVNQSIRHSFSQGNPVLLREVNIQPETIQVVNTEHWFVYQPDLDYEIQPFGSFYQVFRLPNSSIPDSMEVLIHYTYEQQEVKDVFSEHWAYRLEYTINQPVKVKLGFKQNDEQRRYAHQQNIDYRQNRMEREWYLSFNTRPLNADLRHQTIENDLLTTRLIYASINSRPLNTARHKLMLLAKWTQQRYSPTDNIGKNIALMSDYLFRATQSFSLTLHGGYLRLWGDVATMTEHKAGVIAEYNIHLGITNIEYQYLNWKFRQEQRWDQKLYIKFSRNF